MKKVTCQGHNFMMEKRLWSKEMNITLDNEELTTFSSHQSLNERLFKCNTFFLLCDNLVD